MKQSILIIIALFLFSGNVFSQIFVHDPVITQENDNYYLFCTGFGITQWSSPDMKNWTKEGPVFKETPEWVLESLTDFAGHMWAPDIIYHNGQYYLYYSVSAFGKNTSCIGVATNKTLDPKDPEFKWVDHGKVIQSVPGKDNWNAIDPNIILDKDGTPYMFFGSFWDGLKRVKLSDDLFTIGEAKENIETVASRKKSPALKDNKSGETKPVDAGPNAIEAPFVFQKNGQFYLFESIDYCCRGIESTYKVVVGRSKKLTGKFTDKDGVDLAHGGGSIVLQGNENWHGVGHNAVVSFDGKDYLVCHGYDANDGGHPKLIIREISWTKDGWPAVSL